MKKWATTGIFPSLFSILVHPNTSRSVDFALAHFLAYPFFPAPTTPAAWVCKKNFLQTHAAGVVRECFANAIKSAKGHSASGFYTIT
jgi:hypothetical protein